MGFTRDTTHTILTFGNPHTGTGWQFQWEYGAYVNIDVKWGERLDRRLTYNYPQWRRYLQSMSYNKKLPSRFEVS